MRARTALFACGRATAAGAAAAEAHRDLILIVFYSVLSSLSRRTFLPDIPIVVVLTVLL